MTEETFVMIKPDGVRKKLVGEIIKRFELKGLNLKALKLLKMSREIAEELYSIHRGRPFFDDLVNYVTSGEVVVMVLSGEDVISAVRKMMGATNPKDAEPGTIRGDFALDISENIIHGSDSKESVEREIPIFFKR